MVLRLSMNSLETLGTEPWYLMARIRKSRSTSAMISRSGLPPLKSSLAKGRELSSPGMEEGRSRGDICVPLAVMTRVCTTFCSSRTLPGQL